MRPEILRSRLVSLACGRRAPMALLAGMAALCLVRPPASAAQDTTAVAEEFGALDIDELGRVRITSVSRKPEPAALAAAAVTVISREDIRRMGAMTLPDVLRSVPGMTVARVGARDWAVSARGFNHQLANKLLVLVDGRAVYSPIFGGVFWDMLAFPMNEIDRIEVIRGPGASLWGVNAVTGVVNIITRPAAESHGGRLVAGVGTRHRFRGSVRYGDTFGEGVAYRVYAGGRDRRGAMLEDGTEAEDDWRFGQAGFRVDGPPGRDRWSVQGDVHTGSGGNRLLLPVAAPPFATVQSDNLDVWGGNLLARWSRELGFRSGLSLQASFDRSMRRQPALFGTLRASTFDLDFQHRLPGPAGSDLVWGAGYRLMNDEVTGAAPISFDPARRTTHLFTGFVQDEFPLSGRQLLLTVGSRLEHNNYTGVEIQPNVRLLWLPGSRHTVWGSVSRAVRTPSRLEDDATAVAAEPDAPVETRLIGRGDATAENLIAFEGGYRTTPGAGISLDLALFHHRFTDLRSLDPGTLIGTEPRPVLPISYGNHAHGRSYGVEVSTTLHPLPSWRLRGTWAWLDMRIEPDGDAPPGSAPDPLLGDDPVHQATLHSSMDLPGGLELDLVGRYVGALESRGIPRYASARVRLGWHQGRRFDLSIIGEDLLESRHLEFPTDVYVADNRFIERRALVQAVWRF